MKSEKYIFLGYLEDGNGYRLYNKSFQKIIKARDVVFIENVQRKEGVSSKQTATKGVMTMCEETLDHDSNESAEVRNDDLSSLDFWDVENEEEKPLPVSNESSSAEEQEQATEPKATTLRRSRKSARREFKDYVTYRTMVVGPPDPTTLQEGLENEACDS